MKIAGFKSKNYLFIFIQVHIFIHVCVAHAQTFALVKDINTGTPGSEIENLTIFNNKVFFSANDSVANNEVWTSDGTAAGTMILKNLKPGSSYPREYTEVNGKLFFTAGGSIYVTDGSSANTKPLISSINDFCFDLIGFKDKLYYANTDGVHGYELWVTNGLEPGKMLKDINPAGTGVDNDPSLLKRQIVFNDNLYFIANDGILGFELWKTDGTEDGTVLVKETDTISDIDIIGINAMNIFNNKLYFISSGNLWFSDGTSGGTIMIKSNIHRAIVYGDKFYFYDSENKPHLTDGTISGTFQSDTLPQLQNGIEYKGIYYFQWFDNGKPAFYRSDGTLSGTFPLKPELDNLSNFTIYRDKLYFTAEEASKQDIQLWFTDGIKVDKLPNLSATQKNPLYSTLKNQIMISYGCCLFFKAKYTDAGEEFWKFEDSPLSEKEAYNRKNATKINIYPNPADSNILITTEVAFDFIDIIDINGKKTKKNIKNNLIDISTLAPGFYILQAITKTGIHSGTFIKI